jgi:hypothetical protein
VIVGSGFLAEKATEAHLDGLLEAASPTWRQDHGAEKAPESSGNQQIIYLPMPQSSHLSNEKFEQIISGIFQFLFLICSSEGTLS